MEIWRSLDEIPKGLTSVVTIGNFDGMHEGHRKVISAAVTDARAMGVQATACTFDPHPRQVHNPDSPLKLISPLRDRLDAMAAAGLNATFVIHYDESVYTLTPREFVEKYVVDALGAAEVVVGKDFRFGRNNSGDLETLSALGEEFGFSVTSVDDVTAPEGRRWSSSWVRQLLEEGDVSGAARVLGRLNTAISVGASWDSPPQTSAMTSKVSFPEMEFMPAGSYVILVMVGQPNSCLRPFRWERTRSLTGKCEPLKRMSWAEVT